MLVQLDATGLGRPRARVVLSRVSFTRLYLYLYLYGIMIAASNRLRMGMRIDGKHIFCLSPSVCFLLAMFECCRCFSTPDRILEGVRPMDVPRRTALTAGSSHRRCRPRRSGHGTDDVRTSLKYFFFLFFFCFALLWFCNIQTTRHRAPEQHRLFLVLRGNCSGLASSTN